MASAPDVRSADIEFLFEALNYAASPLTINVSLMGAAKDAKPNTLAKRISVITKRYNLNITSTTKGEGGSVPVTPSKSKAAAAKTPASSSKRKASAKVKQQGKKDGDGEELELVSADGEKEGNRAGKKQKMMNGDAEAGEDAEKAMGGDVDDEELA